MSEDEYQALFCKWAEDIDAIQHDLREFDMAFVFTDEGVDHLSDIKNMVARLREAIENFRWPEAQKLRDFLFQEINNQALIAIRKADALVAKTKAAAEQDMEQFQRELQAETEARMRRYAEEHERRWAEIKMKDHARMKTYEAAAQSLDEEVERRVQIRLYGIAEEGKRPRRPLRIG